MKPRHIQRIVGSILGLLLLAAPWLIPMVADNFWLTILTEILIWSLLAASVNFLFGYVGLLSFGQALYFGFGMYGVALGVTSFGLGFWAALGLGVVSAVSMAAVAGMLAVRLTWHYFAIITLVFSLIFYFLGLSFKGITGGDDGTSFALPPVLSINGTEIGFGDEKFQYFFILITVALCFWSIGKLIKSPLGKALLAIRDNSVKAELIGLNVYRLKLLAFVIAGFVAGLSGALFAFYGRYASVSYMFYHQSGEAVVWAIVGGAGTLLGPFFGTALFIFLREMASTYWQHYALIVGAVAILVVIYLPTGLLGAWNKMMGDRKK
jgi:branched-chain amino acid transport system permease protein